jgi:hypothetical protein
MWEDDEIDVNCMPWLSISNKLPGSFGGDFMATLSSVNKTKRSNLIKYLHGLRAFFRPEIAKM